MASREDLDVAVWTHGHGDHIGSVIGVLNGRPARPIVYNGFEYDSATFDDFTNLVTSPMIPTTLGQRRTRTPGAE